MTDIADNDGSAYEFKMPRCAAGEVLSYRLLNITHAKQNNNWQTKLSSGSNVKYHFTDTIMGESGEIYDLGGKNLLETVLCPTLNHCTPGKPQYIVPSGKNRAYTRQRANQPCSEGAFMYYGWEDQVPPAGDADFDDIRVVIECPLVVVDALENVVLIK